MEEERNMTPETSTWVTQQDRGEEILKQLADENGGRLERNAAGFLTIVHDPRDLLQR